MSLARVLVPAAVLLLLVSTKAGRVSAPVAKALAPYPPLARARFTALLAEFERRGYRVEVTSGYRPGDEGLHGQLRAIDQNVVHLATGRRYSQATPKAAWEATGLPALIRAADMRWGGDFKTPYRRNGQWRPAYDPVHIDLGKA